MSGTRVSENDMEQMRSYKMTTIKFYKSRKAMQKGICKMEAAGYKVVGTEAIPVRYSCVATMFFPPLVFFKKENFKVQFSKG